jgi:outer membrane protein OmpA-like peptidoglycan-associated protein
VTKPLPLPARSSRGNSLSPISAVMQRKCGCGQHTGGGECEECKKKKEMLQRKSNASQEPGVAPPIVNDVLHSPGQQLDLKTQRYMESRFEPDSNYAGPQIDKSAGGSDLRIGAADDPAEKEADRVADRAVRGPEFYGARFRQDFSGIRVHADDRSAEAAHAVNAEAFTVGQHVVFGAGRYAPTSMQGKHLLAHELTHSLQQHSGRQLRRSLSVDPNLAPGAPPADPSASLTPAQRFTMMDSLIQKLCPKFHVNNTGVVESASLQSFSPDSLAKGSHGTGCCCVNILTEAPTPWTIEVSSVVGAQTDTAGHRVFLNPTDTPLEFGAFTASNKMAIQGPVSDIGHELCGHAALTEINAHPQVPPGTSHSKLRLTQDIHDPTIRIENKISEEQGVPASDLRGLARSGSHRGESVDKLTIEKFAFDKTAIPSSEQSKIDFAAQYIHTPSAGEDEFVGIRGHSDNVGSPAAKQAVSVGRAKNVESALKSKGVPATITPTDLGLSTMPRFNPVEGVGDTQPPPPPKDADPANWRRVEIFMSSKPAGRQVVPGGAPTVTSHTQNPNVAALKRPPSAGGTTDECVRKLVEGAYP